MGGDGTFLGPSGIAPLNKTLMLVVDECRHAIAVLDEHGTLVRRIGPDGSDQSPFRYPTQAVGDGTGGFWVTDRWNHCVRRLDASGHILSTTGRYGVASGEFNEPWGLAQLDDGRLVVADRSNHRLHVLSADGATAHTCGQGGYDRNYYEGTGFKCGYVFRRWSALSNRFCSHETLFHEQGYTLGTLEYPQGIAAAGGARVLVADPGLGTVMQCMLDTGRVEPLIPSEKMPLVPTNIAALGHGLFLAMADVGHTACLLDEQGNHACIDVAGVEHLTASAPGPGSTLWCLDGWNHRLTCCDCRFEWPEESAP